MSQWRQKPILLEPRIIEAFKWTGDHDQIEDPDWIVAAIREGWVTFQNAGSASVAMQFPSLSGTEYAHPGDYLIREDNGLLSSCSAQAFENAFEPVGQ